MKGQLKAAIVGAGKVGAKHAEAYIRHPDVALVGICDLSIDKASSLAQTSQCDAHQSLEALLKKTRVDLVSVATAGQENGSHHFEPVYTALQQKIPVLCEKPLSNNYSEAEKLVRLARENKTYLGVNLNHRFVPFADQAKQWVDDGTLGQALSMNFTLWISNQVESSEWFHLRALHSHSIDIMRFFLGDIRRVQMFANRSENRQCWSNAQINLQFASGAIGHLCGSYDASKFHDIERCEILGKKGRILLENCFETLSFFPHDAPEVTTYKNCIRRGVKGFDDTFNRRINRWIEQVRDGVSLNTLDGSGAEALKAQQVIEAAIQSWQNNGAVIDIAELFQRD